MKLRYRLARALLNSTSGEMTRDKVTRHVMYRRLVAKVPVEPNTRTLSISKSRKLVKRLGLDSGDVVAANYPKHDILDLTFADNEFDYLVADQVLEHVAGNPFQAAAESLRVVRPGGYVIHTTCLINPIHSEPDYWRFTPTALELIFAEADVIEVGGWGNRAVMRYVDTMNLRRQTVPKALWHPLHQLAVRNEPKWPIVTWVVARKRDGDLSDQTE